MNNLTSMLYKLPKDMLVQIVSKTLFYDKKVDIQTILSFRNQCEAIIREEIHLCRILLREQTYNFGDISIQLNSIYGRFRYRYEIKITQKNEYSFALLEIEDKYSIQEKTLLHGDCFDADKTRERVTKIISTMSTEEQKFIMAYINSYLENTERIRVLTEK